MTTIEVDQTNVWSQKLQKMYYLDKGRYFILKICLHLAEMNYFSIPASYWYHRVALNLSTRNSIVISVKVSTDFYVGLTRDPDNYVDNTMYKIIIGRTNTQSIIR